MREETSMVSHHARSLAVDVPVSGTTRHSVWPRFLTSEHPFPWLAPITALLLAFGVYPLLYALWLSLHQAQPGHADANVFDPDYNWMKAVRTISVSGTPSPHLYLYDHRAASSNWCSA
jgi:multiple sugar transport system permease protein